MGKNIGGTLGAPMEWKRQVNEVTFYTQELGGDPLPNDDLDLQLVWLVALEEKGIDINARTLGEYWHLYITPHWAEYGIGKANMRSGLVPPLSGTVNNPYKDSCGAFIRSEIWACIAPGCPEVATRYAYEDAIVDHGNGEGMYAEIFCAAIESAAFVEKNPERLIGIGLSYIQENCGIASVVKLVLDSYQAGKPYLEVRDEILQAYRAQYWGYAGISQEDRDKGFADGPLGWDAPANIGFLIIGWLYGEGDFEKSLCITVNCGEDTDCTAATMGSLFGILYGIDVIPPKWMEPIGRNIKTMCLNLGEIKDHLPATIDALTERVEKIAWQVVLRHCHSIVLSNTEITDFSDFNTEQLYSHANSAALYRNINGPVYAFDSFDILIDYIDGPYIRDHTPVRIKCRITNKYKTPESLNIKWYADDGWLIAPSRNGKIFLGSWHENEKVLTFELSSEKITGSTQRFALEITVEGKHTVMLVPIVLLNENLNFG